MPQLITIGETMTAFTPSTSGALRYIRDYSMRIAGAESNTAIGVAKLGFDAGWISRIGDDEFGQFMLNSIRAEGVDCSKVKIDERYATGIMFKEMTARETKVFYYRDHSAASHLQPEDVDETYLSSAKILHLSGITPVLSESCLETVRYAVELAKKHHVRISFDPNIRKKLWKGNDYSDVIRQLTLESDVILMGLDEAETLFSTSDIQKISGIILEKNPNAWIAIKDGAKGSVVICQDKMASIPPHPCKCIEPIGAGDAFNAGFLCGILENKGIELCGKMGNICGALATESIGDIEGYPSMTKLLSELNGKEETYR